MFRIAHLSDLHFKEKFWKRFVNNPGGLVGHALHGHCDMAKKEILHAFKTLPENDVDLLLVTGDIATSGESCDLMLGKQFIDDLESCGSIRRVAVIPGNHDRYQSNGVCYFFPGSINFENYFTDHNAFGATVLADMSVDSARLVVIGVDLTINTAYNSVNVHPCHYLGGGAAYKEVLYQAVALTNAIRNGDDSVYVVWACHFPPGADMHLKLCKEGWLKVAAQNAQINLALFGHTHETRVVNMGTSEVQGFVVSSALSYCFSRKAKELRAFSVIDIDLSNGLASPKYYYWQEAGLDPSKDYTYR